LHAAVGLGLGSCSGRRYFRVRAHRRILGANRKAREFTGCRRPLCVDAHYASTGRTDAQLRESFVERVFAYDRWLRAMDSGCTPRRLVDELAALLERPDRLAAMGASARAQACPGALTDIADACLEYAGTPA